MCSYQSADRPVRMPSLSVHRVFDPKPKLARMIGKGMSWRGSVRFALRHFSTERAILCV